jgi:hypothetical protein
LCAGRVRFNLSCLPGKGEALISNPCTAKKKFVIILSAKIKTILFLLACINCAGVLL